MKTIRSTLFFLSVILFNSLNLSAQIPNSGFENWIADGDGILFPEGWETTNNTLDTNVKQYTPAYQGNYAMQVKSWDAGFMLLGGSASISFPYVLRPTKFKACLKSTLIGGDTAYIFFALWKGDSIIASSADCTFKIVTDFNQYTCIDFPIKYQSLLLPDSASIIIMSGLVGNTHVGTNIIVDELSFVFGVGINEQTNTSSVIVAQNFPNPASSSTSLPVKIPKGADVTLYLYDILGNELKKTNYGFLNSGEHNLIISLDDLPNGIYQIQLKYNGNVFPYKKLLKLN